MNSSSKKKKLLFLVAEDSYFCSHRLNLAKAALNEGYEVAIATRCNRHRKQIENAGITVFPLQHFKRTSLNPWQQIVMLFELYKIYRDFNPDIVHHVALKPVLLGSLTAIFCKIPKVINALGGLGYLFAVGNRKQRTLKTMILPFLRFIFARHNTMLILQNKDDLKTLLDAKCLKPNKAALIRGAGVDLNAFPFSPEPNSKPIVVTLVSRMLWDKGIGELVKAALILKEKNLGNAESPENPKSSENSENSENLDINIRLYGSPDPENPGSIPEKTLQQWQQQGIITWHGHSDDIAKAYRECHIAVLPSYYREGLPKSLLEAASIGRPIITTDFPGCREVVQHEQNGLLIPPRDPNALADAILKLASDSSLRAKMGQQSRTYVEREFADTLINKQVLQLYCN